MRASGIRPPIRSRKVLWCCLAAFAALPAPAWGNAPPVCNDASKTVRAETYGGASIRVECVDPDGDPLKLALVTPPRHARRVEDMVEQLAEKTPRIGLLFIGYEPIGTYVGTDTFTYTASDGVSTSNIATVTVEVTGPPMYDSDGDGMPDGFDNCPSKRGSVEFEGCPSPPGRPQYFFEYRCGRRHSFDYVFWPSGHTGPGTPSSLSAAEYLFDHVPPMIADLARPQLSVWPTGRGIGSDAWAVYTDSRSAALPASGSPCEFAGPSPHLTAREWLHVRHAIPATRPTAVRCRFRGAGHVGVWGRRGGNEPVEVTHVIANELTGSGRRTRNRTILRADLSLRRPKLRFDRTRCKRLALPAQGR